MSYFSMHNHSMYSCLDGYGTPKECLDRAREVGLAGYAITDHGYQCAWPYFDSIKKNYPEIKMVYGVEFYECKDIQEKDASNRYWHLLAIARNEEGRKALNWMVSKSKDGFYYKQRVDLNMFRECFKMFSPDSIIVSTACLASHLSKEKNYSKCIEAVAEYKSVFPHFYLEMQSHRNTEQEEYNKKILALSKDTGTPYVITTDSHYSKSEDEPYQKMLVSIAKDKETIDEVYQDCYIQSEGTIHDIMDSQIGSECVANGLKETMNILAMIDTVNMPWSNPKLPKFPVPNGQTEDSYIRMLVTEGYEKRKISEKPEAEQKKYKDRIEYELSVIEKMDFTGYFLIVHEYVQWAKNNGVAVGVGRGSGAGCIVNYLLFITDVDPLKYGLIFERFLNPERVSMPDIDSDFDDRDKVIAHMEEYYGKDSVARVINYVYITPLVAVNIVSSQLGVPFKEYTEISKPFVFKTWVECMINLSEEMKEDVRKNSQCEKIFDYAAHLCGRVKNIGIHAGGVVIGQTPLYDYMGTIKGNNNEIVICLDKKNAEPMGLIKFDVLGLANLKMIREAEEDLNMPEWEMDTNNQNFINDQKSYDVICSGNTDAVFQMESTGMKQLIKFVQPRTLDDLSLVIALYRPDALKSLETYKENKLHPENTTYWCEAVKPILQPTCGALVYQEQLMDIVRVLGGRTYGGADKFRKGIGKKDTNLIKAESEKLEHEIIDNGYSKELANKVSTYLSEMGGYSFNRCISGDTQIWMMDFGEAISVESLYKHWDLYKDKNKSVSMNTDTGKIIFNKVMNISYSGFRKVYCLVTENGQSIVCTDNHKFPTPYGDKMLKDLKVGDMLYYTRPDYTIHSVMGTLIKLIKPVGMHDVYDVEMASPYHNFVLDNGLIVCNSHAVCYAVLGLQTAYLKAHYPAEFYKCLLNLSTGDTGALSKYIKDAQSEGVAIVHPDINRSMSAFSISNDKILFGFSSISGLGEVVCQQIIEERNAHGKFTDFKNFLTRCPFLNVSQIVSLIKSGALPAKDKHKLLIKYGESLCDRKEYTPIKSVTGTIKENYDKYGLDFSRIKTKEMRLILLNQKRKEEFDKKSKAACEDQLKKFEEKYMQNEYMWEFETLSMFISSNPFKICNSLITPWEKVIDGSIGILVGVITNVETKKSKNGNQYGFVSVYTSYGNILEATCWAQPYIKYRGLLKKGNSIVLLCRKDKEQVVIERAKPYNVWRDQQEERLGRLCI